MSNANVDRRTALIALGVVAAAGATAAGGVSALASAAAGDAGAEGALGLSAGDYRVVGQSPVEHGAMTLTLVDEAGDRFGVTLCARDDASGAPRGPARTERFDLFVDNEGRGDTPTDERRGIATMALADALRQVESALAADGLLPLRERLARHAGELVCALA
jgi:hypothetical protein